MMDDYRFHDNISLAEVTERLGKKAVKLGLIHDLTVRIYSDNWQFQFPNQTISDPLTPEEAYFQLKALVEQSV